MPVYFVQAENGLIKIGCIKQDRQLVTRLKALKVASPVGLTLLGIVSSLRTDRLTHRKFIHLRHHGEWFTPGQDLIEYIEQNAVSANLDSGEYDYPKNSRCKAITQKGTQCTYGTWRGDYCTEHR